MKKIVHTRVEIITCDGCGENIQYSPDCNINFGFSYGSEMDGYYGDFQFCQDCAVKIYKYLKNNKLNILFKLSEN